MKSYLRIGTVALITLGVIYLILTEVYPLKWRKISLGDRRIDAHQIVGKPTQE